MRQPLEPDAGIPSLQEMKASLSRHHIANGATAFLYAITGPLAILLAVATGGGLSTTQISSWIFACYGLAGLLSLVCSLVFRQPLALVWTIPGALLLPAAFDHLDFSEILGAYWLCGIALVPVLHNVFQAAFRGSFRIVAVGTGGNTGVVAGVIRRPRPFHPIPWVSSIGRQAAPAPSTDAASSVAAQTECGGRN